MQTTVRPETDGVDSECGAVAMPSRFLWAECVEDDWECETASSQSQPASSHYPDDKAACDSPERTMHTAQAAKLDPRMDEHDFGEAN